MSETEQTPARQNPLVAALLSGKAPRPARLSAARGILPIDRSELLKILVVLARETDTEIRDAAAASLGSFKHEEILAGLSDSATPGEVLAYFGTDPACHPEWRAALIANPSTPAETLRTITPLLTTDLIDQLLLNQTRLIAIPELLDLLADGSTPLTPLQESRVEEIRRHFLRPHQTPEPVAEPAPPIPQPSVQVTAVQRTPETTATENDTAPIELTGLDLAAAIANATQKIMKMNIAERVQLALKGTREERSILIKDSSKMVQEAVLDSPKLNENEIEGIAKMRSVGEDVLRIIAGNRNWIKSYAICHSLSLNPKTPVAVAMNLVVRLTSHDLKMLGTDKNVSEAIRRHAKKVMDSRNQRSGAR